MSLGTSLIITLNSSGSRGGGGDFWLPPPPVGEKSLWWWICVPALSICLSRDRHFRPQHVNILENTNSSLFYGHWLSNMPSAQSRSIRSKDLAWCGISVDRRHDCHFAEMIFKWIFVLTLPHCWSSCPPLYLYTFFATSYRWNSVLSSWIKSTKVFGSQSLNIWPYEECKYKHKQTLASLYIHNLSN